MSGELLDSNVLVYAFTADRRAAMAQSLLERGCIISVQGLNEFTNVARRKLGMTWKQVRDALDDIRTLCPTVLPIDTATHSAALDLAERHGYAIFDALMIASALLANCDTLWSEDMQHGMVIDKKLRIADPFRAQG
jgi:predicted nucleic acid-binding protein